ncbi:hypothetical protein ABMA32_17590 [Mesorhizobium sp. VNQ89]|uniref:hypothetical protein n=1 Tax=Mesorhizobium quangtriensis TaxID=3157709 RepID=UPI0032B82450
MKYEPRNVSDDELETSYTVPTAISNTFVLRDIGNGAIRIAFGERRDPNSPAHYRVALALPREQAFELKLILGKLLEQYEPELEKDFEQRLAELNRGKSA